VARSALAGFADGTYYWQLTYGAVPLSGTLQHNPRLSGALSRSWDQVVDPRRARNNQAAVVE